MFFVALEFYITGKLLHLYNFITCVSSQEEKIIYRLNLRISYIKQTYSDNSYKILSLINWKNPFNIFPY